ncbi:30S ribosomal protein S8 [Candidatus Woesearchaeota archaeon]|nr:30S ribosomal protein S8 [Candidatus Woesearchaeota archaeon]
MTLNDPLSNVLSHILNNEKVGKNDCVIHPGSKTVRAVLDVFRDNRYIGAYETIDAERGGFLKISLLGNINKCGVVKPRFSLTKKNYETYEKRFLPAKGFGILVVSTSKGIMVHTLALQQGLGGRLLAYCY